MTVHNELRVGYGAGRTTEAFAFVYGRHRSKVAGSIPLVVCHGFGGDALQWYDSALGVAKLTRALGLTEQPLLGADLDGLSTWGRAGFVDAIEDIIVHANSVFGTRTDLVGMLGLSMGGLGLNWVRQNANRLAAYAGLLPVAALDAMHDRDPGGRGATIESAYGGTSAYNAALAANPSCDPNAATSIAVLTTLKSKMRLWYSSDDTTVVPSEVTGFASAVGCEATNVGAVGHSLNWDTQQVVDWLIPQLQWA